MERHDLLMRHVVEGRVHLRLERCELLDVRLGIRRIGVGMRGICLLKLLCDVLHLLDISGDAEPDVRILFPFFLQQRDAAGGVDDRETLLRLDDLVEEILHPSAVHDEGIRFLQRLHILRRELIVMQAARLWLRHVRHRHAVDATRDVDGIDVHRIERCHDAEAALRLLRVLRPRLRAAAREQDGADRQKH